MPRNAVGKAATIALAVLMVACASDNPSLESAKARVCESAPQWEATLQSVAQAEADPGTARTALDELSSGLADATQALTDAGATAIAEAASSFEGTIGEISTSLDQSASEAAEKASAALTRLNALTTLAGCE